LVSVTRNDAKAYRNHRFDAGVKPSSIRREISTIKAVIAKATLELSLGITNQFSSLEIAESDSAATVIVPYSVREIRVLVEEAVRANDEQRRIVVALAFTGARLAEIVGLRVEDVDLTNNSIRIRPHPGRKLKNKQSEREVPLLEPAIKALAAQVQHVGSGMLFPRYARDGIANADSASGALNKWAKRLVPDKTMHCFRHSLRDALRAVMCPDPIAKELGGWSTGGDVSTGYGSGYPLRLKREWLEQAYEPVMIDS
jgi:integrase